MDTTLIEMYANMLSKAEKEKTVVMPLTEQCRTLNLDYAYGIQLANVGRAQRAGEVISGKKIGLTTPGMQLQMCVGEPDYGHLFESMNCKDGVIKTDELIQPKVEVELAFVLKEDLPGGQVTAEDVCAATDYVCGAFEIVDSRIDDWRTKLIDTVADNASSARYILGKVHLPVSKVNLASVQMKLYKNGKWISEGEGKAVLGDPAIAVAWLANRLWGYGITLQKGEVILSGAFSSASKAKKGDEFVVDFYELGKIKAKFE